MPAADVATDEAVRTVVAANAVFVKNMAALWRSDPELAAQVDAIDDEERLPLEITRSGPPTVAVPSDGGGRPIYLHSRYDPLAEAAKLAESVPTEDKLCFVLCGLGLGYHLRALYERLKGDFCIAVIEPSLRLLSTALAATDLADIIASRRVFFLTEADKAKLHVRLHPYNARMMLGAQFVVHPPSQQCAAEFHATLRQLITDYISYTRMSLLTLVANAQITCRNIAMNLPTYVSTPPIDILADRFKGCPAIIVSAGPSLSKNMDLLHQAKGKAVICAVQTTFRPLLQRGIVPDFVTSLDYHEISRQFYEGIDDFHNVHLVAEPKASWHVIDHYRGPVSLLDNSFAHLLIGDALAGRGGLTAGATVAHLAFYLARYMGCDPIVFIGQDLAFTGHVFYVPGVDIHHTWRGEINRFNTMESKEWERIVRNRDILRMVPDIDGKPLYTDDLLFTYLEQFEKDFQGVTATLINASEGGANIRGTEVMKLRDVIDRFCRDPIDRTRFAYRDGYAAAPNLQSESATGGSACDGICNLQWPDSSKLLPARDELAKRQQEIDQMAHLCDELLALLAELKGLTDDPLKFNQRLVRVDELRTLVQKNQRAYQIINAATQLAELRRFAADRRLEVGDAGGAEKALNQIVRDQEYIGAIREGARQITEMLSGSMKRFDEALAQLDSEDLRA